MLVAMPWQVLQLPSIQLGLLQPLLEAAGIRTELRSFKLDFMEHCRVATRAHPEARRIGLADYEAVAADHYWVGLGEWIFAVPPFREGPGPHDAYLDYVRRHGVSEGDIEKALAMRALVPTFLETCVDDLIAAGPRIVGFTCTFSQTVPSLVLAKLLKQRDPSLIIVFGGANCDGPMGAALLRAFSWVDVVVRGEAEDFIVELMADLLRGTSPRPQPGLCYRGRRAGRARPAGRGEDCTGPAAHPGRSPDRAPRLQRGRSLPRPRSALALAGGCIGRGRTTPHTF